MGVPGVSVAFLRFILGAGYSYGFLVVMTYVLRDVFQIAEPVGYAIVQAVLLSVNFLLARRWVFADSQGLLSKQIVGFLAINVTFRVVDWGIFNLLLLFWTGAQVWSAVLIAMCFVFPLKFLCYRYFVFRPTLQEV